MQDFSRASHLAAAGQPLREHNFLVTEKGMVVHNNGCMAAALGDDPLLCRMVKLQDNLPDQALKDLLEIDLRGSKGLELLDAFSSAPELLDTWKALKAFPTLRILLPNLKVLDKIKSKFTFEKKSGQEALEAIFSGHKSAQKLIDNLDRYDKVIGNIDGISIHGLKSSAEVRIISGGSQVGKFVDGTLHVSYSGFGGNIVCDPNKTTTLLGKWKDPAGGGTSEIINSKLSKNGKNIGGPNVLSVDIPIGWTNQQIWDNVNEPWLDAAASRGDFIRAVSDPLSPSNKYKNGVSGELSFFGREHEHLTQILGYTYNPSTFTYSK